MSAVGHFGCPKTHFLQINTAILDVWNSRSFESHDGPLLISGWFLQSHIEESIRFALLPRDSTDQPVIIKDQPTALLHGGNREVA